MTMNEVQVAVNGLTNKMGDLMSPAQHQLGTSSANGSSPAELSRTGSEISLTGGHGRLRKDTIGYKAPAFPLRDEQRKEVEKIVSEQGFIPTSLVRGEVGWFYESLGIDNTYFLSETPQNIADHILALYGAKVLAYTKHDPSKLTIDLERITTADQAAISTAGQKEGAVFIHSSVAGVKATEGPAATVEKRIDELYIDNSTVDKAYRLETYRSTGAISTNSLQQLRCYFVARCQFPANIPKQVEGVPTDIRHVSDKSFLEAASDNTLEIYQSVMNEVERRSGPVIEMFEVEESRERRVVIGYKMGGTQGFFSALSDLYHFYGLFSARKYVEQFANGITIISLYLNPVPNTRAPPIEHSIHQVIKEASLLYTLPTNEFFLSRSGDIDSPHAAQEAAYAYVGWIFAQHFCNRLGPSFLALKNILDESNPAHAEVLQSIKVRFRDETFTRQFIQETIMAHPEIVRALYINFAMVHYPAADEASQLTPTLSFQRLRTEQPLSDVELQAKIRKTVPDEKAQQVLEAMLVFNKHVLKTNFYQPTKVALSFRLDPSFLPAVEYPLKPYGIFFIVGSDFRGFHVRFGDVARGGIRIVRSRGKEDYGKNARTLFDENYGLASTQNLKNKDIPERGSKGTILPILGASPKVVFEKYIDALLDLLIPGQSPGIKEKIVDVSGRTTPEILFLGPDENTADLMDWACLHAKARGASFWKSFTTGKSAALLGGIPHDRYGMTSLSVRQYILGVYRAHGLREQDVCKMQTAGPDGDLGSNEILLSNDKTIGMVDGSGVIYDPAGLDREELLRLAKARSPLSGFDDSKLSTQGYKVLLEEKERKLPSGEVIQDGTELRNKFHFRVKADIFVPCGGRPAAIDIGNVANLLDADGKPVFKYVVEGANLFITQQARLFLEKHGVELYKDSSTNKGGVTSSSLEVLAGLALLDDEYASLMMYQNGKPSLFYETYVKEIQAKICENAAAEYTCIAHEYKRNGGATPRSIISDQLSTNLNELQTELEHSDLYDNEKSRLAVLKKALPVTLVKQIGVDELVKRLPEPYLRALWSVWIASNFIYKNGLGASQVAFYHFMASVDK
jgi:glutamate dehydrogenase